MKRFTKVEIFRLIGYAMIMTWVPFFFGYLASKDNNILAGLLVTLMMFGWIPAHTLIDYWDLKDAYTSEKVKVLNLRNSIDNDKKQTAHGFQ